MNLRIGLLFDLDGTIIHVPENFFEVLDIILDRVIYNFTQKKLTKSEIHAFWKSGRKFDEILQKWGINDINEFWSIFDEEDLEERIKMIGEGEIYLFEDAKDIINELKNKTNIFLGIISNTPASIAYPELDMVKLSYNEIFHEIFVLGSQNQYKAKPQPDIIFDFMNKYQISNKNMYIIGDTDLDIQTGKNANINTIFIKRAHNSSILFSKSNKPKYIIENLIEIKNIIM